MNCSCNESQLVERIETWCFKQEEDEDGYPTYSFRTPRLIMASAIKLVDPAKSVSKSNLHEAATMKHRSWNTIVMASAITM